MEEKYSYQLVEFVLPSELLHYFVIVKQEQSLNLFRIHIDEKMTKENPDDVYIKYKGFMDAVKISDFSIRNHKVILFSSPSALVRYSYG